MVRRLLLASIVTLSALAACELDTPPPQLPPPPQAAKPMRYPETKEVPVTDDYGGGVTVVDNYRWLEDGKDPEVQAWQAAETHLARVTIDKYPGMQALRDRLTKLYTVVSPRYFGFVKTAGALFAEREDPGKQQPVALVMKSVDDPASARVLVDPSSIDKSGATAIDFLAPSLDGKLLAISLSKGGSEDGDLHLYDVASGKELPDRIEHVNGGTAGGSVAWNAKGTGFYYTRYPKKGERPDADLGFYQQLYFHELGQDTSKDRYVLGKELPKIAEIYAETRDDGKWTLVTVANGDGGEYEHFLAGEDGVFQQITKFEDAISRAVFGRDDKIYFLSKSHAPRGKILRVPVASPSLPRAETIVPERSGTMRTFTVTASKIWVVELDGGPSHLDVFDLQGKEEVAPTGPKVAAVESLERLDGDAVLYALETYIQPPAWYLASGAGEAKKTPLALTSNAAYDDAEVLRESCVSKDGTKVPINIIRKKGAPRDGSQFAILSGYGGFGLSREPRFSEAYRVVLDAGGAYAIANLRGGGEFGEAWHQAGARTKKQNVFDDFAGCAQYLIDSKLTTSDRLAIVGGSNGGLLVGAALTQHPELFRAVVAKVGLYDMLRFETFTNGAFNVTEYGSVKNPEELKALFAYSPYHHVVDGAAYPAVLFTTGVNDPRVAPWQSRKMAARLQSASGGRAPVLFLARDTGHGIGSSLTEAVDDTADTFAFIFEQMDISDPYAPPSVEQPKGKKLQ